ncbi:MAG: HAMP domain-containing histidine kinase, partial [Hyphomicrobiales bacterium]|nr:HAMP domain-containing histidine kinase [Hyphomicrobiales bacterium]
YDEEGINEATKESILVSKLVDECTKLLGFKAKEKEQTITTELTGEDVRVFVNREKMIRVLSNLISNAIKFSPFGAIITITSEKRAGNVLIAVKDKGIGVPKDMQDGLFEIFSPNVRNGTAGEKSYGLGLFICKQITEAHGGKIWLESKEGEGSTFFVELPH